MYRMGRMIAEKLGEVVSDYILGVGIAHFTPILTFPHRGGRDLCAGGLDEVLRGVEVQRLA